MYQIVLRQTWIVATVAALLLTGCTLPPPESTTPAAQPATDATASVAENLELVRETSLGIWGEGKLDLIDTVYADDYVSSSMAPGEAFDREALKQEISEGFDIFADHGATIEEIFGEGDLVAVRYAVDGTPQEYLNAPAEQILVRGISIVQVEDGKIVREWEAFDTLSMLTQFGFMPAMAENAPADVLGTAVEPVATAPEQQEANRQTAVRISKEMWGGNQVDMVDEVYADDFVYHNPVFGTTPDTDGIRQSLTLLHQTLSDSNATVEATVVADNRVAVAWSLTGLHTGDGMGIAPTGNEIFYQGLTVYHFNADGQVIHEWNVSDDIGLLGQMGAMESATVPAGADTTAAHEDLPTVTFTTTEYAYDAPDTIAAGPTRLEIANEGQAPHDISLVKLAEGKSVDDVMTFFQAMASGEEAPIPDWVTFYGGAYAGPGQTSHYLVDLEPGNYVVYSLSMDELGVPDAAKGMIQPLTVTASEESSEQTASSPEVALPAADLTVELVDFQFVVDGEFGAGGR